MAMEPNNQRSNEASPETVAQTKPQMAYLFNKCAFCRAMKFPPPCKCKQPGGGGNEGGESEKIIQKTDDFLIEKIKYPASDVVREKLHSYKQTLDLQMQLREENKLYFNSEIISDMLAKRLLIIKNDHELGILTIKCNPNLITPEQKISLEKYVIVILNELSDFKEQNNIKIDCAIVEKDVKGNFSSLQVTLPTPTVYDKFIQQLADKNLLPLQVIQQQKVNYQMGMDHFKQQSSEINSEKNQSQQKTEKEYKSPTPFSTKLKPIGYKA